jgi:hypothetical protein
MAASRHLLVPATQLLSRVLVVIMAASAVLARLPALRLAALAFTFVGAFGWWWQWRERRTLILDDEGWAIEGRGGERVRVAWREVVTVLYDKAEEALYLDSGERARNLLVPPRRGFGFYFEDQATLCARVLASVPPEIVAEVERLDKPRAPHAD